MKKIKDVPARKEVTDGVEKSKKDMNEKEIDIDKVATDIETVRQTLENLDFGGTKEGAEQLRNGIENAEQVTTDVFDKEDEILEKIQSDNEEFEEEMTDHKSITEADLGKVSDASAKIETKEAVGELVKAKEAALRDIDFLKNHIDRAKDSREKSNAIQEKHQDRVHKNKRRSGQ